VLSHRSFPVFGTSETTLRASLRHASACFPSFSRRLRPLTRLSQCAPWTETQLSSLQEFQSELNPAPLCILPRTLKQPFPSQLISPPPLLALLVLPHTLLAVSRRGPATHCGCLHSVRQRLRVLMVTCSYLR
jgi:hypothetical protein